MIIASQRLGIRALKRSFVHSEPLPVLQTIRHSALTFCLADSLSRHLTVLEDNYDNANHSASEYAQG